MAKAADGGYRASAGGAGAAEPFRMQATALGRYLLLRRASATSWPPASADVPAARCPSRPAAARCPACRSPTTAAGGDRVQSAAGPSEAADWRVDADRRRLCDHAAFGRRGQALAVDGGGKLVLARRAARGGRFDFVPRGGCRPTRRSRWGSSGDPHPRRALVERGARPDRGHVHVMAFEFLGGRMHCGRPWHRSASPYALVDCPDHGPAGQRGGGERPSYGNPCRHATTPTGWPTFRDWPKHASLPTSRLLPLARALVAGRAAGVREPAGRQRGAVRGLSAEENSCNEMDGVRLQARRIHELEDYIDAQSGGPGKGWFRIVTHPFEARRVINQGKLAVILGIEVSKLFGCDVDNGRRRVHAPQIDRRLDEIYDIGVRDMGLVNKFDNALGGRGGRRRRRPGHRQHGNRSRPAGTGSPELRRPRTRPRPLAATAPGVERDSLAGNVLSVFGPTGLRRPTRRRRTATRAGSPSSAPTSCGG